MEDDITFYSCRSRGGSLDNENNDDHDGSGYNGNDSGNSVSTYATAPEGNNSQLEDEIEEAEEDGEEDPELNGNGLVETSVEESLGKEGWRDLKQEEKELNEMFERQQAILEACNKSVMERTEALKAKTDEVEGETKAAILERDQALQDLRGVEQAFSDVHRKYERAKLVLENLKINEDHLNQRDEELQLMISSYDEKNEAFKQEMHQSMERMYTDFQAKLSSVETENTKLTAVERRLEMRAETLAAELEHKRKENAQLNVLADELIGKRK